MPTIRIASMEVKYLAERDFRLRHLINHIGDIEYHRPESAFHSLSHSIIEQMLSMKVGHRIESRLVAACGGVLEPTRVLSLELDEIRACGISRRKAHNLQSLAEYAIANDLESMAELSDLEVSKTLLQLPGIGKWSCDMFLLFYLERYDILPLEDAAIRQAFKWLYKVQISTQEAQQLICSLWHPYSSISARYLYEAINTDLINSINPSDLWNTTKSVMPQKC